MTRDEALLVIDRLYAAAHGETAWHGALTLLADQLGHSAATLEYHDVINGQLLGMEAARIDPASAVVYEKDYAHCNPRVDFLRKSQKTIVFDQLILDETQMDRHPFYAAFLKSYGLRYFMALHMPLMDGYAKGVLSLQRSSKSSGPDSEALAHFERLSPHLKRALAVYWRRQVAEIDPDYFDRALAGFGLTEAERKLGRALVLGETLAEYGQRTGLSMNTVYTHFRHVKGKLDCRNQSQLATRLQEIARADA